MDVHIGVPAFEEGEDMLETLESINRQRVPEYVDHLEQEVWVTLSPPDRELCTTWQAAMRSEGFEPVEAPPGKLSARNDMHTDGAERGFDVLVTWDADAPAKSDETLANLLEPFNDPNVSAVRGEPVSDWHLWGTMENVGRRVTRTFARHLHGQLSAFTADAWRYAGPFDESIDQTEFLEVWKEEEKAFAARLREHGEMRHASGARVFNDSRRRECKWQRSFGRFGRPTDDWCGSRGEETFHPRR